MFEDIKEAISKKDLINFLLLGITILAIPLTVATLNRQRIIKSRADNPTIQFVANSSDPQSDVPQTVNGKVVLSDTNNDGKYKVYVKLESKLGPPPGTVTAYAPKSNGLFSLVTTVYAGHVHEYNKAGKDAGYNFPEYSWPATTCVEGKYLNEEDGDSNHNDKEDCSASDQICDGAQQCYSSPADSGTFVGKGCFDNDKYWYCDVYQKDGVFPIYQNCKVEAGKCGVPAADNGSCVQGSAQNPPGCTGGMCCVDTTDHRCNDVDKYNGENAQNSPSDCGGGSPAAPAQPTQPQQPTGGSPGGTAQLTDKNCTRDKECESLGSGYICVGEGLSASLGIPKDKCYKRGTSSGGTPGGGQTPAAGQASNSCPHTGSRSNVTVGGNCCSDPECANAPGSNRGFCCNGSECGDKKWKCTNADGSLTSGPKKTQGQSCNHDDECESDLKCPGQGEPHQDTCWPKVDTPQSPQKRTEKFKIAVGSQANLAGAAEKSYTTVGQMDLVTFENPNFGEEIFVFVEFTGKDEQGNSTRSNPESASITLAGPNPVITSCRIGNENDGTPSITLTGTNFGNESAAGTVKNGSTTLQPIRWSNTQVRVGLPSAQADNFSVTLTRNDGKSGTVACSATSPLALQIKQKCRPAADRAMDNVQLTLIENTPGARAYKTTSKTDNNGVVQDFRGVIQVGRRYKLSAKVSKSPRKVVSFNAQEGTNNVVVDLPIGDIFPLDGGDGVINSPDKGELNRQWILSDGGDRTGDFNSDSRVNTIDWSCMRNGFNSQDQAEPTPDTPSTASPSSSLRSQMIQQLDIIFNIV